MKIALCISGKPRSSMFCYPYIYDAFMNNKHQVDVFIHSWNQCRVLDLYKPKKLEINSDSEALNMLLPMLNLNGIKIEGNVQNNILMYYSIKRCFDLIEGEYDAVIRTRFDLLLQPKFDIESILNDLSNKKYDIYIPTEEFNMGGYNDQLAIGTYDAMKIYSDTFLNLNKFAHELGRWHPETFLGKQLKDNNIKVHQTNWDYRLVRNVNVETHWPENPYKFLNL
jgi:hypothetical protein